MGTLALAKNRKFLKIEKAKQQLSKNSKFSNGLKVPKKKKAKSKKAKSLKSRKCQNWVKAQAILVCKVF